MPLDYGFIPSVREGKQTSRVRRGIREIEPNSHITFEGENERVDARVTEVRHEAFGRLTAQEGRRTRRLRDAQGARRRPTAVHGELHDHRAM